jgi:hypothetical protein
MPKHQYKVIEQFDKPMSEAQVMNRAEKGWELLSVTSHARMEGTNFYHYFRRPTFDKYSRECSFREEMCSNAAYDWACGLMSRPTQCFQEDCPLYNRNEDI